MSGVGFVQLLNHDLIFYSLILTHFMPLAFLYPQKTSENQWVNDQGISI